MFNMQNFTNVYTAVKWHCEIAGFQENKDWRETIAETADVPVTNMSFYLNLFENLGLITYSPYGSIELTEVGVNKEKLFA